jgi:hypothetical protein
VQLADGGNGRAVVTMEAIGCQPNPWRINSFALEREAATP